MHNPHRLIPGESTGGVSMRKVILTSVAICAAVLLSANARAQQPAAPASPPPPLDYGRESISRRRRRPSPRRPAEAKKNGWSMCDRGRRHRRRSRLFRPGWTARQFASITISQHKARAAATFKRPTKVFEDRDRRQPGGVAAADARRRDRLRGRHSARGRRQDRRRDGLQRRHRPAGRRGLPGRRQRGEIARPIVGQ